MKAKVKEKAREETLLRINLPAWDVRISASAKHTTVAILRGKSKHQKLFSIISEIHFYCSKRPLDNSCLGFQSLPFFPLPWG